MRHSRQPESRAGSHRRPVAKRLRCCRSGSTRSATLRAVLTALLFCCGAACAASRSGPSASPSPGKVKIVVFPFELEDSSAAGSMGSAPDAAPYLTRATEEARRALLQSGRYTLIDPAGADLGAEAGRGLRNCNGCEAAIARKLGADQSLIGVILRPEMVEYGAKIWITDARDGRILSTSALRLSLGGPESWVSGVRLLMPRLTAPARPSAGTKQP
ncbi:DUF2380 domain-containing protein [Methylacidimicrobium sp. B4]|uniref:DUF2380 domain-containing protein n=1 Tax=Methylacidimicrobium sp. B4 TaxID=2796139 RepID=UPI001A8F0E5C|nr:DUF2380 domain-containing protein [Methylacidimicrobium sp. B4]QSR84985.1 DUF2380 domain-containing protein [Methylacidimicrobium sp. B4]